MGSSSGFRRSAGLTMLDGEISPPRRPHLTTAGQRRLGRCEDIATRPVEVVLCFGCTHRYGVPR